MAKDSKAATAVDNSMSDLVLDLWDEERGAGGDGADEARADEADGGGPSEDERGSDPAPAGPAVRLAWSAAYSIRTVVVAVAVFAATALVLALVLNPDMTLVEAAGMYADRIGGLVSEITGK